MELQASLSFDDYDTDRSGEIDMGEFIRLARFMRLDPDKEYVCVHMYSYGTLFAFFGMWSTRVALRLFVCLFVFLFFSAEVCRCRLYT